MNSEWKIETKAVQCGYEPGNGEPRILPLVQSTTFKYDDAQSVADLFDLKSDGFFYSRLANPTVAAFERKMAALEGGVAAVAVSAGQTANAFAIINIARSGDHVVAVSSLYGGTVSLLTNTLHKMGIEVSYVSPEADEETIRRAFRPNTKALFAEALANPALIVLDIERFARIAHEFGVPLIVDNTFPTPILCRPFEFGADIVTHSTTKYTDGHATSLGGIVIEKGGFNWANGKFPEFVEPDPAYHGLVYTEAFRASPYSVKLRVQLVRDLGAIMAPMNAFLSNLGLETLHLRMERHSANALAMAEDIRLASVQALGAVNDITVGVFDTVKKEYHANHFQGAFEIVSLTGTIDTMDGNFYTHLHMSAGDDQGRVFGGHLNRAMVSATCEMLVRVLPGAMDRAFSPEIGLNLLKF